MKNFIQKFKTITMLLSVGLLLGNAPLEASFLDRFRSKPREEELKTDEIQAEKKQRAEATARSMAEKDVLNKIKEIRYKQVEPIIKDYQERQRKNPKNPNIEISRGDALATLIDMTHTDEATKNSIIEHAINAIIQKASGDKAFTAPCQHLKDFDNELKTLNQNIRNQIIQKDFNAGSVAPLKQKLGQLKSQLDKDFVSIDKETFFLLNKRTAKDIFKAIYDLINFAMIPINSLYESLYRKVLIPAQVQELKTIILTEEEAKRPESIPHQIVSHPIKKPAWKGPTKPAPAAPGAGGTKLYACGDIEGSWHKVATFIKNCNYAFCQGKEGCKAIDIQQYDDSTDHTTNAFKIQLHPKVRLAFLGDIIDGIPRKGTTPEEIQKKYQNNIKVLKFLIALKRAYINIQDKVILTLGNRDINKIRLLSELKKRALKLNGPTDDPSSDDYRYSLDRFRINGWGDKWDQWLTKNPWAEAIYAHGAGPRDKEIKFKFLMSETLGAAAAFDNFKAELQADLKKQGEQKELSDSEVVERYMEIMLSENGLIPQYQQLANIIHYDKETKSLLAHGKISPQNLGRIPKDYKKLAIGKPQETNLLDIKTNQNLLMWINQLNEWAHKCMARGIRGENLLDLKAALPVVQYQEPSIMRDEKTGNEQFNDAAWNTISVTHTKPWNGDKANNDFLPVDGDFAGSLLKLGVNKSIFGHTPVGEIPVILKNKDGKFLTVACDTTFGSDPFDNAAIEVTADRVTVYTHWYKLNTDIPDQLLIYSSANPFVGTPIRIDGKNFWYLSPLNNGNMLVGCWKDTRKVEYREVSRPQIAASAESERFELEVKEHGEKEEERKGERSSRRSTTLEPISAKEHTTKRPESVGTQEQLTPRQLARKRGPLARPQDHNK